MHSAKWLGILWEEQMAAEFLKVLNFKEKGEDFDVEWMELAKLKILITKMKLQASKYTIDIAGFLLEF